MQQPGKLEIEGVLIDLDGVLYVGDRVIDGAREAIDYLRRHNIPRRYITNTTTRSIETLQRKLLELDFPIDADEIISAPYATVLYLRQQGSPSCWLLLDDDVRDDFSEFEQTGDAPDYIVIGDIGDAWSYDLLNRVFQQIMRGSRLIALHRSKFWQTEHGLQLDIGAFVVGLEYASGREALVIGKPSPAFFRLALDDMGLSAEKAAIVGDDIDSDVAGGQACGLSGILVKTGKYRDDYAAASGVEPDLVLDSIAQLPQVFDS
jgi:HAD superfamily hydrolase (TIGR01458 family)